MCVRERRRGEGWESSLSMPSQHAFLKVLSWRLLNVCEKTLLVFFLFLNAVHIIFRILEIGSNEQQSNYLTNELRSQTPKFRRVHFNQIRF